VALFYVIKNIIKNRMEMQRTGVSLPAAGWRWNAPGFLRVLLAGGGVHQGLRVGQRGNAQPRAWVGGGGVVRVGQATVAGRVASAGSWR